MRDVELLTNPEKKEIMLRIIHDPKSLKFFRGLDFYVIEIEGVHYLVQDSGEVH